MTDQRVLRAIRTIEDAHFNKPTVAELAAEVELSPDHFLKLFKAETGLTPIEYLRNNWLDQAAFRLSVTADTVSDLFGDFGYLSQAAFTRAFAKRHGVSPAAYQAAARAIAPPPAASVRLRRLPARSSWAKRYLGSFADRAEHWSDCLARLPDGLADDAVFVGLNHDDPRIRPRAEQRYDCCIGHIRKLQQAEEDALRADGFEPFLTTAGLYACAAYRGDLVAVGETYAELVAGWLPGQDRYVLAGEPIMEAFKPGESPAASGPTELEVCIMVAPRDAGADWTAGRDQRLAAEEGADAS